MVSRNSCNTISAKISARQKVSGSLSVGILGVKTVYQFATRFEFPTVGDENVLYIATDENAAYRWNDSDLHYYCVGRDYLELEQINGGNANGE